MKDEVERILAHKDAVASDIVGIQSTEQWKDRAGYLKKILNPAYNKNGGVEEALKSSYSWPMSAPIC
jgi:hypothetical protein